MRARIRCPNPACDRPYDIAVEASLRSARCPACEHETPWHASADIAAPLAHCPACGGDELYVRKDFPQKLGVALVVAVGLLSIWFFARGDLPWAMGVLVALVLVDLLIYQLVPKITICYRCRCEFRDLPINPDHRGFDLATAEKYR